MKTDLAIYDMDRTVTRRATYTPFLLYCAWRLEPGRLLLLPIVAGSMLAYVAKFIDRGRLKEINHRLLLGDKRSPALLKPLIDGFAAVKQAALSAGAMGASISGAGPSVFAWFESAEAAQAAAPGMQAAFASAGHESQALVSPVAGPAAGLLA